MRLDWAPEVFGSISGAARGGSDAKRQADSLTSTSVSRRSQTRLDADGWLETPRRRFGVTNSSSPKCRWRCAASSRRASGTGGRCARTSPTTPGSPTARSSTKVDARGDGWWPRWASQFVLDAGWWTDPPEDPVRFHAQGLGSWQVDADVSVGPGRADRSRTNWGCDSAFGWSRARGPGHGL